MLFFLILYSALYTLAFLVYLPFYLARSRKQGRKLHLLERAGWAVGSPVGARPSLPAQKRRIWIQAVSVGEVNVIKPLVEALRPDFDICVSTTTETGQVLARKLYPDDHVFYFPLDWGWLCRRFLRIIQPSLVLLAETEIWPNLLFQASRAGIPVLLVNGRISDRSFGRYRRIRLLLVPALRLIRTLCMQSKQDKQRIIDLGAPPDRVIRVGNLKYDYELKADSQKQLIVHRLAAILRPDPSALLWVCGSTREEEEVQLAEVFVGLKRDFPSLRWLVAPRHTHRAAEVIGVLANRGLNPVLRSNLDSDKGSPDVVVLDTIGELAHLYQLADLVFIGGSLVPWGGHNIIEAANFGKPITFGPYMQNFREIADTFLAAYAAIQVSGQDELMQRSRDLLQDAAARKWIGGNARRVVRENQGAVKHTVEVVRGVLPKDHQH